jgi:hypothetical protein
MQRVSESVHKADIYFLQELSSRVGQDESKAWFNSWVSLRRSMERGRGLKAAHESCPKRSCSVPAPLPVKCSDTLLRSPSFQRKHALSLSQHSEYSETNELLRSESQASFSELCRYNPVEKIQSESDPSSYKDLWGYEVSPRQNDRSLDAGKNSIYWGLLYTDAAHLVLD